MHHDEHHRTLARHLTTPRWGCQDLAAWAFRCRAACVLTQRTHLRGDLFAGLIAVSGDIALAMAAVLVAGLTQITLGLLRVGGLVRFIPCPVVSGFMSGIGAIIVLLQIAPLLGASPVVSPLAALVNLPAVFRELKLEALLLSGLTLLIVFATPMRISRVVPSPLVALVLLTLLSVLAGFDMPVIGGIPAGLPELVVPSFPWQPGRRCWCWASPWRC